MIRIFLFSTILLSLSSLHTASTSKANEIRTLVSEFSGSANLGRSVATILNLQLWRTLRTGENSYGLSLGHGTIFWFSNKKPIQSHTDAAKSLSEPGVLGQIAVWGHVQKIDTDAFITTHLTIPKQFDFRTVNHEIWTVKLPTTDQRIDLDIPRRKLSFEPIVLPSEFVEKYDLPKSIQMTSHKGDGDVIGYAGANFRRIQNSANFAQIQSDGRLGWIYLPEIGENESEVVDFVAGLIRIFRADWSGAIDQFQKVLENQIIPTSIKIDSLIHILRAKSEMELDAEDIRAELLAIGKRSVRVARSIAMYDLHKITSICRAEFYNRNCEFERKNQFRNFLEQSESLFAKNDEWYLKITQVSKFRNPIKP